MMADDSESRTVDATERESVEVPSSEDVDIEKQADLPRQYEPVKVPANDIVAASLAPTASHISNNEVHPVTSYREVGDEVYDRFSLTRKNCMVAILSLCGFLSPISSTTILAAVPEVAATYHTNGTIINLSNAMYLVAMAISPVFWGPIGQTYGRRWTCIVSLTMFFAFSIGTALAPNLVSYFVFRILTAIQGTCLLIVCASCIGDIFRPTERATALGWFLSGALIGPAFGPFIGGIIVTFASWRDIFWLQTALGGLALVLVFFFLPETIHYKRSEQLKGMTRTKYVRTLWQWINPWRVIRLYQYPNLLIVGLASSSLIWNMYSLLTPIRYVLNPRFHLTSPLQSGLFYIAPGCGYLLGTFFGGKWADHVVKKWIRKRGRRIPEDRLRSSLVFMGIIVPGCMLIYGWSVEKAVGGIPLPVIAMVVQGVAQQFCFPSLNAYCLDVMQRRSAEVVACNYLIRYIFAAAGTASCLPAIEAIGVGWSTTISSAFLVGATLLVWLTTHMGERMRGWVEKGEKSAEREDSATKEVDQS